MCITDIIHEFNLQHISDSVVVFSGLRETALIVYLKVLLHSRLPRNIP